MNHHSQFNKQNKTIKKLRHQAKAFTLIELMLVVAIIAVLAIIASANFLEIQTRVKTTRIHSDHRTMSAALELRRIDVGTYPSAIPGVWPEELQGITTPISYMTQLPVDPFNSYNWEGKKWDFGGYDFIRYQQIVEPYNILLIEPWYSASGSSHYAIVSSGPNLRQELDFRPPGILNYQFLYTQYDPTNGTISAGDLYTLSN